MKKNRGSNGCYAGMASSVMGMSRHILLLEKLVGIGCADTHCNLMYHVASFMVGYDWSPFQPG